MREVGNSNRIEWIERKVKERSEVKFTVMKQIRTWDLTEQLNVLLYFF